MRMRISHHTVYLYDRPVFIEPHTIRLRPRSGAAQQLEVFDVQIVPAPVGVAELLDEAGNDVTWAWFQGTHERLEVTTRSVVSTARDNPFDYILPSPADGHLPMRYAPGSAAALVGYLQGPAIAAEVTHLADELSRDAGDDLLTFLGSSTATLRERVEVIHRPDGDPHPPAVTLESGKGSCRDLAVLHMACCRHLGIASRFVSGYTCPDPETGSELHAWVEVFVPGGGWRGYDPSLGLAVADGHVAVAAAASPPGAAPVSGSFRGSGAVARMRASVHVEATEV